MDNNQNNEQMNNNMNQQVNTNNGQYQNMNNQYQDPNMNNQYQNMNNQYQNPNMNGPRGLVQETNIILAFVLSICTCGIYGIYWFVKMTDESNSISDLKTADGGMAFLYSLISCSIYMYYWNYQMGKKLYLAGQKYGVYIEDRSTLYLILGVFGLSWLAWIFMQEDLNKFA